VIEIEYQGSGDGDAQLVLCAYLFNRDEDEYVQRLIAQSESGSSHRHRSSASLTSATTQRASTGLHAARRTTMTAAVPGNITH